MSTRAAAMLLAACAALFAACDLNPQPLPPGEQADAAANVPGSGGGGSSSGGNDTGGGDAALGPTDAGERADALPPPGDDGGTAAVDAGADVDAADGAAEDAGADATSADAGDAALD